jgi:hypothetical protein
LYGIVVLGCRIVSASIADGWRGLTEYGQSRFAVLLKSRLSRVSIAPADVSTGAGDAAQDRRLEADPMNRADLAALCDAAEKKNEG